MHYIIAKWNKDKMQWEIVHYTHQFDDFNRMAEKYPPPDFVHFIDMEYVKSHSIMERVDVLKKKRLEIEEKDRQTLKSLEE